MGSGTKTQEPGDDGPKPRPGARWQESSKIVPTVAVVTVVVTAVATALMVTYSERQDTHRPPAISMSGQDVVRAPPLVVTAPPLNASPGAGGQPQGQAGAGQVASNALGAGAACRNCGVVESVGVTRQQGAFQLRIRMDDGSLRTVEQRGAVAPGSRVVLEGRSVRVMPRNGQG